MLQRFKIEDIVSQDATGVVFRAFDSETDQTVALRRFFPFGASGGGLNAEQQAAYGKAIERLAQVRHPAIRSVICGGCDPVDGMPFVAAEWIEGERLKTFIDHAPLNPVEAANLLNLTLEVCQLLSEMLEEEAIWLETSLEAIVVGSAESHRGFTFWISPIKWAGQNEDRHGLESIITLTEEVLGREGKDLPDQEGMGLGAWLKWLRDSTTTASLHEARHMLVKSFGKTAPNPSENSVVQSRNKRLTPSLKKKSSGMATFIAGASALAVIAGGGWTLIHWQKSTIPRTSPVSAHMSPDSEPPESAPSVGITLPAQAASPLAENSDAVVLASKAVEPPEQASPARVPHKAGGVITAADQELLVSQAGNQVIVEGVFSNTSYLKRKKTLHLLFTNDARSSQFRGVIHDKFAVGALSATRLEMLQGRTIRLHGKVELEDAGTAKSPITRPVIRIESQAAIELVK